MKKKILAIAMTAIVAALGLTGCNNGMGINDDGTYTWKMALNSTEGDNAYDTGAAFAKKIEELTDGRVEVVLYGGGSLGSWLLYTTDAGDERSRGDLGGVAGLLKKIDDEYDRSKVKLDE